MRHVWGTGGWERAECISRYFCKILSLRVHVLMLCARMCAVCFAITAGLLRLQGAAQVFVQDTKLVCAFAAAAAAAAAVCLLCVCCFCAV